MKLLSVFTIILSLHFAARAQDFKFPEDWVGQYSGNMYIDSKNHNRDTVEVDFGLMEMIEDSLWSYKMVFHSKKHGMILKDYLIHAKNKNEDTKYVLDEKNGVEIELVLMNNCFFGMYKINDVIYSSVLRRQEEGILFEIYTVNTEAAKYSVVDLDQNEKLTVESYAPQVVQSAFLAPRK